MICMHHHHQHHHQYPLKKNKSSSKRGNSTDRSATAWCHFPSLERRLLAITAGPEPRLYLNTTRPLVSSREMKSFCKPTHICYHLLQSRKKPQFRPQWYSPHDHTYNKGFCLADRWPFLPTGFLLWPKALPTCRVSAHGPSYLQVLCSDQQPFLPAGFVLWPTALLTCRFCALTNSPSYLQVLCSDRQPSLPAGFVLCCPTALLTCRFCALTDSPPYLQVLCSTVQQPSLPAGFVLCCPTALLTCRFCALLSNSPPHLQVLSSELTNGSPHLHILSSAVQQPFLPAGSVLWADQWPSSPACFVLCCPKAFLTGRFSALTDSPPYLQVFCSDQQPSLPAGFLLWPTALLTCRFSALTNSPPYLQVFCSDQQPSLPAGFLLWPTALLTCRFSALTNSPPYLQVFCSDQQPSLPAGFLLWPTALLTCRFSALTNSPPYLQVFCSDQQPSLPAGFLLWPTALLTCRFSALTNSPPYLQVFRSDQQPSLPAGFPLCVDHRRRPGERQTAWSWSTGTAACRTRPVPAAEGCELSPLCCPGTSDPRGSATGHQHRPSDKMNTKVCVLQQFFEVSKNNAICPYNLFIFFIFYSNINKPIWAILCQLPFACRGLSPKDPPPPHPPPTPTHYARMWFHMSDQLFMVHFWISTAVVYLQHWHGWCHMKLLPSWCVLCTPYNHAPRFFMQSDIHKVHACLAITCHLHFWQDDRDLHVLLQ